LREAANTEFFAEESDEPIRGQRGIDLEGRRTKNASRRSYDFNTAAAFDSRRCRRLLWLSIRFTRTIGQFLFFRSRRTRSFERIASVSGPWTIVERDCLAGLHLAAGPNTVRRHRLQI